MLYFVLYEGQPNSSMSYMQYPALLFLLAALSFWCKKETFELFHGQGRDHNTHSSLVIWGRDNSEKSIFIEPAFIEPAFIQPKTKDKVYIEDDDGDTGDGTWAGNSSGNSSGKPPLDPSTEPPRRARFPQLWSAAGESRKKKRN